MPDAKPGIPVLRRKELVALRARPDHAGDEREEKPSADERLGREVHEILEKSHRCSPVHARCVMWLVSSYAAAKTLYPASSAATRRSSGVIPASSGFERYEGRCGAIPFLSRPSPKDSRRLDRASARAARR